MDFETEMRTSKSDFSGALKSLEEKLKGMETGTTEKKLNSLRKLLVQLEKDAVFNHTQAHKDQVAQCQKQIKTLDLAVKNKLAISEQKEERKEPEKKGFLANLETYAVEDM